MHSPSTRTAGVAAVSLSLGTAAAAGLHAPEWVWIVTGVAAGVCFVVAVLHYIFVDCRQPSAVETSRDQSVQDDLARLHGKGVAIRDNMRPSFGFELVGALTDRVRNWDRTVQDRLDRDAPQTLLVFNAEPFPEPPLVERLVQAGPAARRRLYEFMDRKLAALAAILDGSQEER